MNYLTELKGDVHIVFYGDSMTAYGDWRELLGRKDLQNSGIPSLTTHHLSYMVGDQVLRYHPQYCFVMAGINDVDLGLIPERTFTNWERLLKSLTDAGVKPVVQSVIYEVNNAPANKHVDQINAFLQSYCQEHQLDYIDLNPVLSDSTGLKPEYARDEIHLNNKGYRLWAEKIRDFMKSRGI